MKIGVYIHNVPQHIGGGYTIQWDIFQAFVRLAHKSKHEFVVFCDKENERDVAIALKDETIPLVVYQRTFSDRLISLFYYEVPVFRRKWKMRTKFEKLALKSGVQFMWFVGSVGYFLDTIPYIGIVYDLTHRTHPWFPEVSANGEYMGREIFYSWFLRRAYKIIVGTKVGKDEIEKFYQIPSERIKILPHPTPSYYLKISSVGVDRSILEKYKIPDNYLFYPAQFWTHKNHVNLLIAVKILEEKYNLKFPVVFVGSDKGNMEYVKYYANYLNLSSRVYFLGFVPQSDMVQLYKSAFALTYVSFCGPENLPPLEAFALGCPVIAADILGAREQLGDAALFVDPANPTDIALGIKKLKEDTKLREVLVRKGLERAKRWTAEDFVLGVFEIFDEFEPYRRCWM